MEAFVSLASDSVIWEVLGNQVVTANMETGVYCNIDEGTGVVIWHLLLSGKSIENISELLSDFYNQSKEIILIDINNFFNTLKDLEILDYSPIKYQHDEPIQESIEIFDSSKNYKSPKIIPFNDINSLIQVDPIDDEVHEVIAANGL